MKEPRPLQHLRNLSADYSHAFKMAADFRQQKHELGGWPDYVYLPVSASYAIVSQSYGGIIPPQVGTDIGRCAALTAWRATKGVYQFDPELLLALMDTSVEGHIPDELLECLPEWCVYVDLRDAGIKYYRDTVYGFYAHLEFDMNDGRKELRLVLDLDSMLLPVPLHLTGGNLSEAVERNWTEANKHGAKISDAVMMEAPQKLSKVLSPLVSVLLYLCSEKPDIESSSGKPEHPGNPIQIKTKRGMREFAKDHVSQWNVGWRIGAALRAANSDRSKSHSDSDSGRQVRAHIRRAHWHAYLVGQGRSQKVLRWLHPILVKPSTEELPAVIHK